MRDHTLGHYLDLNSTLTPDDDALRDVSTSAWWCALKPFFDDLIWQYFSEREVFCTDKFDPRTPADTITNILRAFAINLKTRNYTYSRLYQTTILDYNPLYNVDAYEFEDRDLKQTGTNEHSHTGKDAATRTGNETDAKAGKEANTRTGNETDAPTGSSTQTKAVTTFDSATFKDTEQTTDAPGVTQTHTYNTVKDEQSFTDRLDTHTYNSVKDETEFNSKETENRNLNDIEAIVKRRYGNIGVTMSGQLLRDERNTVIFDFFKKVVKDCVNCVSYALYS